ncbi:MAG: hypothetical protein QXO01_02940 [Nitrososphaerota archaeon]
MRMKTFSILTGNILSFFMGGIALCASYVATGYTSPPLRPLILVLCWLLLFYFTHSPAHYFAGRLLGIRFKYYFLGISRISKSGMPLLSQIAEKFPYVMGVRIDRSSMKNVSKKRVAVMYLAGPLTSIFASSLVLLIYQTVGVSMLESVILAFLILGNAVVSLYFSKKYGCIAKALKALQVS